MPAAFAVSLILVIGPTRIGVISPACAASTAPDSALSSQGWATAVGIGARPLHRSRSLSYFPVPVAWLILFTPVQLLADFWRTAEPVSRKRIARMMAMTTPHSI